MPKRSMYEEDFDYDDEDYEDPKRGIRKLRRETDDRQDKRREREEAFDRDHDYDERR